ncbi:hypothetical protein [Lactobacillus taiwanensis]|uniref:hypothetical protein n=1 Tax=Lactobacillus taiwanensis TaxID=508451 RepID=UPI0032206E36
MKQTKYFPVVYGVISALIAFIAVSFIAQRTFHLSLPMATLSAGVFAAFFYVLSYFRGHASYEIKAIVARYHLTDQELAEITGMKASDFPIYHNKLQLIIPKRQWPRVLNALQEYDQEQKSKITDQENEQDERKQ